MNVLVITHLSDTNLGDAAILTGTAQLIRELRPGAAIALVPGMPANALAERDTATARREGIEVLAPLCAQPVQGVSPEGRVALHGKALWEAARSLAILLSPRGARPILSAGERRTLDAYRRADLLVVEGGSSLRAESRPSHIVHVWRLVFPVLLGLRLRKRVIGLGHSLGPIERGLPGTLLRFVLRRGWTIYPRDPYSQELYREITGRDVPWIPDLSLALRPPPPDRNGHEGRRVAVSVRPLDGAQELAVEERLVRVLELLDPRPNEVAVIANAFGPSPNQDDRPVTERLERRLRERGFNVTRAEHRDPRSAAGDYGGFDAVFGVRMHAAILARLAGAPSVPLDYEGRKAAGVFSYLAPDVQVERVESDFAPSVAAQLERYLATGLPAEERAALEHGAEELRSAVADILDGRR